MPERTANQDKTLGLSIDWILNLPMLQDADARYIGSPQHSGRHIKWVHIVESHRSAQLLRGEELVLATGVGWGDTEESLSNVVTTIWEAGATCLLIELGGHWNEIPPIILTKCIELGLPLIATSNEIHFVELTEAVHSELLERATEKSIRMNEISRRFSELNQEKADVNELVHQAAEFLKCPVVLEDPLHRIVTYSLGLESGTILEDWQKYARAAETGKRRQVGNTTWFQIAVTAGGLHWGTLLYRGKTKNPATGRFILRQAAAALAIERSNAQRAQTWSDVIERNALRGLLSQDPGIVRDLENHGFQAADRNFVVCRLSLTDVADRVPTHIIREELAKVSVQCTPMIARIPGLRNEWIIVFVCSGELTSATIADNVVDRLKRRSLVQGKMVLSPRLVKLDELAKLVRVFRDFESLQSQSYLKTQVVPRIEISYWKDNKINDFVDSLRSNVEVQRFCQQQLGALIAFDNDNGTDYVATLAAVLAEPNSRKNAADRLHISRSALYNRIAVMEKKLGLRLTDPDAIFALTIATRILGV